MYLCGVVATNKTETSSVANKVSITPFKQQVGHVNALICYENAFKNLYESATILNP